LSIRPVALAVKLRRVRGAAAEDGWRADPACASGRTTRAAASPYRVASSPTEKRIMYQSDITQFINQLKAQKPSLEEEQRHGRALLWDKQPIDLDERSKQQSSRVQQTPYVYYQNF
jgi:hypothetical protein